jgi:hypothetical protein
MKRLLPLILLLVFVASCGTSSTYTFQCAFVTGRGPSDTQEIKQVLLPGEKVVRDPDDQDWYVPCNRRNFIVDKEGNGDWGISLIGRTLPDQEGGLGIAVHGEVSTYWELNRDREVLAQFFEYCMKFSCADPEGSSYETQAATNNSSAGWMEMLYETNPSALDRAFKVALAQFDVGIVDEPGRWPELALAMQEPYMAELRRVTGSNDVDLFCASGSFETGVCGPISISIDELIIIDSAVVNNRTEQARRLADLQLELDRIADERTLFEQQQALDQERADHVASLYAQPGYADERRYLAQLELIEACTSGGQKCIVIIGDDGQADLQLEVPTTP